MKKIFIILCVAAATLSSACTKMDLTPKDKASSASWYKNTEEFEMCLNALLHHMYWPMERNEWGSDEQIELDLLTDDGTNRQTVSRYLKDQVDGTFPLSSQMWNISYKGINRCNKVIRQLPACKDVIPESKYNMIEGCARFYRACFYARIMVHFGDPVVVSDSLDFDTVRDREYAYTLSRSDMWKTLDWVLNEFDAADSLLPYKYSGTEVARATKGAAMGMKARFALHFASIRKFDNYGLQDLKSADSLYRIAAKAAKRVIEDNQYKLHDNFGQLFRMSTKNSPEGIFILPRSKALSAENKYEYLYKGATTAKLPRLSGAATCCTCCPSWDLLCAFYDNKGLPIDESVVYNPRKPFENRDPRLTYTIVEHGTEHLGVIYEPSFDVDTVYSRRQDKYVTNNDSRTYKIKSNSNQYASFNGLVLKKHVDEDWLSPFEAENDKLILRYADVLEIYAEAKIELGDIDKSVVDAMNAVRARAYGVSVDSKNYPQIAMGDQAAMRKTLRAERRMEFAFENLRLYDIWRWRIAEKVLNYPNMGLPAKSEEKKDKTLSQVRYMNDNMWFHGATPQVDDDDCPNFTIKPASGENNFFSYQGAETGYAVILSTRKFVAPKSYLWPIPTTTTQVMPNVDQNEDY